MGCLVLLAGCTSGNKSASGAQSSTGNSTTPSVSTAPSATGTPKGSTSKSGGASKSATPTATPSASGGIEGGTGKPGEKCQVTSSVAVAAAFAAKVASETVTVSGIGSPLCKFTLTKSGAGAIGGLSASVIAKYPATAFAQSKKSSPGAQTVTGLGSSAFYVPKTSTLKVLVTGSAVTLQYGGYLASSAQPSPDKVRAALISLATGYVQQN